MRNVSHFAQFDFQLEPGIVHGRNALLERNDDVVGLHPQIPGRIQQHRVDVLT